MSSSFDCPSCGASYTSDQVAPGQTFTCGACHATVTAPSPAPPRPAPAAPKATPPPARASASRPRTSSPGSERRPAAASSTRPGRAPAPAKSRTPLLLAAAGAVVVLGVALAFAFGSGGGGASSGGNRTAAPAPAPPKPDPTAVAAAAIAELRTGHDLATADGAWHASRAVAARVQAWKKDGQDARAVALLEQEALRLEDEVLRLDPDHAALHEARGERKYAGELEEYTKLTWLDEALRTEAQDLHGLLARLTAASTGWAPKTRFEPLDPLLEKLRARKADREALESSPFYREAHRIQAQVESDLNQRFSDLGPGKWLGVEMSLVPPFVFFVQKDPSWIAANVATNRSGELTALEDIIRHDYGRDVDLPPIENPVPVLMFRNYDMYKKYSGQDEKSGGAYAHFEPMTGRLAVHDDCDHTTIMHEGTHQLMWAWTRRSPQMQLNPNSRSYWFNEGIAEWYGGAHRVTKPEGGHEYEIGLLHSGRVAGVRENQGKQKSDRLFTLPELIGTQYLDRPRIEKEGRTGVLYGQAWFLIYFLNHFNVDAEGFVHPDQPGKYRDRLMAYVREELAGRSGLEVFLKTMGLDAKGLDELEVEYWRFFAYICRKNSLGEIENKKVIPWDQKKNKRGELVGEKEDDRLPPFVAEDAPPRKR